MLNLSAAFWVGVWLQSGVVVLFFVVVLVVVVVIIVIVGAINIMVIVVGAVNIIVVVVKAVINCGGCLRCPCPGQRCSQSSQLFMAET